MNREIIVNFFIRLIREIYTIDNVALEYSEDVEKMLGGTK